MTRLVLIDEALSYAPGEIVAALDDLSLDGPVINILDLEGANKPGTLPRVTDVPQVKVVRQSNQPSGHPVFFSPVSHRSYLFVHVGENEIGNAPDIVGSNLHVGLAFICVITDSLKFKEILHRLENKLFALVPSTSPHNLRASYGYFSQLFENMVAPHGVLRETSSEISADEFPWHLVKDFADRRLKTSEDSEDGDDTAGNVLDDREVGDILRVREHTFFGDASNIGLQFVKERSQMKGQEVHILASGEEGIVFFGPNIAMSAGKYVVELTIDTKNLENMGQSEEGVRLRFEVTYDGGNATLEDHAFTLAANQGEFLLEVPFFVPDDEKGSKLIETRLWVTNGFGRFRLVSYRVRSFDDSF